jgi:hypothetical protein
MCNKKYDAIRGPRIDLLTRIDLRDAWIPADARTLMGTKMATGCFTPGTAPDAQALTIRRGRGLDT